MNGQRKPTRFKRLAVKACLGEHVSRSRLAELLAINVADVEDESSALAGRKPDVGSGSLCLVDAMVLTRCSTGNWEIECMIASLGVSFFGLDIRCLFGSCL
jgi:hypothetical protein